VKLSGIALGSAVALIGGSLLATPVAASSHGGNGGGGAAAECGVFISGGTVLNETVIDLSADGGTAISDASGGWNNEALTGGGNGGDGEVLNTASAGNGGVATSSASGGAISLGDVNSGGNVGNAISVGDTHCGPVAAKEAAPDKKAVGAEVVALPDTGVGIGDMSGLFALVASAGAAVASLGLRRR
jgi:hypothetical protein